MIVSTTIQIAFPTGMTQTEIILQAEKERSKLVNFIRKYFGAYIDAEDIVQDVFVQLVDKFEDLRVINNLTGWLYRAAKNKAIDRTRKMKPSLYEDMVTDKVPLSLDSILPTFGNTPEDDMMSKAIAEALEQALQELPEEQREAFVLHEFEEVSFKEMALMLNVTENTLISRKRYAVLYLRERLKELYDLLND